MRLNRHIVSHLSWQGSSVLTQALGQLGVMALLARLLSPAEFGLVAAANIPVTFALMFAEAGIGAAIVRRPELSPGFLGVAMAVSVAIGAAFFAALGLLAFPFESFYGMPGLGAVTIVLGVACMLAGVCGVLEGKLQRDLRFDTLFRVNLAALIVGQLLPAVLLAVAGAGVWALVGATVGRFLVKALALIWVLPEAMRLHWPASEVRELLNFGFGLTQDRFWNWTAAQAPTFLIGLAFGQELLGQFSLGLQLATLPFQHLTTVVSAVFFPMISRVLADHGVAGRVFLSVVVTAFVSMSVLGVFLAVNASLVVEMAFGAGWDAAVPVFQLLCLGGGIRAAVQLSDALNIARGDVYRLARRRMWSAGVMVVVLAAAPRLGLIGGAWAVLAAQSAMLAFSLALAIRGLGLNRSLAQPFVRQLCSGLGLLALVNLPVVLLQRVFGFHGMGVVAMSALAGCIALTPVVLQLAGAGARGSK